MAKEKKRWSVTKAAVAPPDALDWEEATELPSRGRGAPWADDGVRASM